MNALLFVLLAVAEPDCCFFGPPQRDVWFFLPPLSDQERLPQPEAAERELRDIDGWVAWTKMMQAVNGWEGGRWHRQLELLEWLRGYWSLVDRVRSRTWIAEEVERRMYLEKLRRHVGEDRYRAGWEPNRLPLAPRVP